MRFISNEFRSNIVDLFLEDVVNNVYYLFVSTIDSEIALKNTVFDKKEFLAKTIFGKKINPLETFPVIKNYPWQPGEVYEQYNDKVDLTGKKFYTVVYPEDSNTGAYLVFKCLFNNYGQTSQVAPFYDAEVTDQIYNTADGYVWKFMYSIPVEDFDQYNAFGFIPIIGSNSLNIDNKMISHIEVENLNTNFGYAAYTGSITAVNNEELLLLPSNNSNLNPFTNFYRGQTIYVTDINNVSRLYDILTYSYNTSTGIGRMKVKNLDSFIQPGSTYTILPKIEIQGDGYGAEAIPLIISGQIRRVIMLNKGYGYNSAIAKVIDPEFGFNPNNQNTSDERAIIRPILAPNEGHGENILKELHCNSILLYAGITESDNIQGIIPKTGTYCRIGVVKNPMFWVNQTPETFDNRIRVEFETDNFLQENERVFQIDESTSKITFEAVVHESANNTVYLAEYVGPYQNIGDPPIDISFDENLPLRNETNQNYVINNSTKSDYVQRTGEVIYIASFTSPIFRDNQSREQFKVILQF
jgi:hypothetical protein